MDTFSDAHSAFESSQAARADMLDGLLDSTEAGVWVSYTQLPRIIRWAGLPLPLPADSDHRAWQALERDLKRIGVLGRWQKHIGRFTLAQSCDWPPHMIGEGDPFPAWVD
jgi:hypothetical protein